MSLVNGYQTFRPNLGSSSVVLRYGHGDFYIRTPDSEIGTGQFEGPGPISAEGRSNLQDPCNGCSGVYVGQNIGPTAEGTQMGSSEWTTGTVEGGRACCTGVT